MNATEHPDQSQVLKTKAVYTLYNLKIKISCVIFYLIYTYV